MRMAARFAWQLWWLSHTRRLRTRARHEAMRDRLYTAQAQAFTRTAMEMGGLIIKLGQHISVRVDMLPAAYTRELAKLQDSVAPVPVSAVQAVIEDQLGLPVAQAFPVFEADPIAAASLGQVHGAELPGGIPVAVKVLRPGIEDLIETDLRALRDILVLLDRWTAVHNYVDVNLFYSEFHETLMAELDMEREGANAERFQKAFLMDPTVDIPRIYWERTSRRVLTMERMQGIKINEVDRLDAAGIDRPSLARNLIRLYVQMILQDGFFHADPHPGNILVSAGGMIQLLDFGMVGRISDRMRSDAGDLAAAVVGNDPATAVRLLTRMGFLRPDADTDVLISALRPMLDTVLGFAPSHAQARALAPETLEDLREFMFSQPFQLPGNVTFLGKALITVVGVSLQLDPQLQLIEELAPMVSGTGGGIAFEQLRALLGSVLPTVRNLSDVVAKANRGELTVRLTRAQEARLTREGSRQTDRLARTIIGTGMALAGGQMLGSGVPPAVAWGLMGLGSLIAVPQAAPRARRRRRR
jgi:predicted unusual protein kinase regulating ubiquinone biosynthesis (AarF/ABC1/UbiB family)